ncbi:hypothetical protein NEAUS03_1022 [Nematocida ausubeli]|uniref:Vacuolar ATPase assembly integral membrane protein VMA21 n=1 Tax=Nematocida ausubeli (strain ATCC PRA-371 / ERTm2) TaxID=1913371 RepID=H8ZD88_NEMA1|nr:hypothetical protein NERG_01559 [Nematocida ausubeli]KAI5133002.1 hypothetical protein NEAUS07_0357 [Nematocida ausubeli]KAI5136819.1 hypothetical protein NEAUS06_2029 [Nematocida ausubeli]KAI5147081.1 hypothetical protein NEAUS05_0408 [Nematocida ausubeli]KAI5160268.1 hypothetical protein NEAUS03_1022 [Nematocida ausubeli]
MNMVIVCAGLPVLPLAAYFAMKFAEVDVMWRVFTAMLLVILYVLVVAIVAARKVEEEELNRKKTV